MLEQLNSTLEEEKKTLLGQVNKLLEQNQNILVRTLESKDQALEEERIFKYVRNMCTHLFNRQYIHIHVHVCVAYYGETH